MRPLFATLILLSTLVAAPLARADLSDECAGHQAAIDWWKAQSSRLSGAPADVRALHNDWLPRLQTTTIQNTGAACSFLDALLRAVEATNDHRAAVAAVHDAATALEALQGEVVRPALFGAAEVVGARIESEANATNSSTQARIALVTAAESVYARVGMEGEKVRLALWREAEQAAWDADNLRMEKNLAEADGLVARLDSPFTATLYVARIPVVLGKLEADARIMETHEGSSASNTRLIEIEEKIGTLRAAQPAAVGVALLSATAIATAALLLALLFRAPLRRLQSDLRDIEVSLLAVPK